MKTVIYAIALSWMVSFWSGFAYASDLFSPTLGISQWSNDTTLKGFKANKDERFRNHHKREIAKFEKESGMDLFSIVENNTRFGDTAFYFQAPSGVCYNRKKHDCERSNGESQKRVEANYGPFRGTEFWFTVSLKLDEWNIGRYSMILTQFHSDVPQYQPMILLRLNKRKGMWIEHLSANGFQFVEGGSEECASGAADIATKNKNYCPKLLEGYTIMPADQVKTDEWYDFVYHVNFDKGNPEKEFLKVYLNGKLVVNTEGTGKIVQWPTMPGVGEWENKIKFNFGIYGTSKEPGTHSAWFDEIGRAYKCESLNIERLGYDCADLKSQNKQIQPGWTDSPDI